VADLDDHHGKHPIADLIDNPIFPDLYSIQILLIGELFYNPRTGELRVSMRCPDGEGLGYRDLGRPVTAPRRP
jgi:hypothetical protein